MSSNPDRDRTSGSHPIQKWFSNINQILVCIKKDLDEPDFYKRELVFLNSFILFVTTETIL